MGLPEMQSTVSRSSILISRKDISLGIQPPQYLLKLHAWPDLEIEDFGKPWKEFQPFLEAHGYALFGSHEYDIRSTSGGCPTKAAKEPFHPSDDEDFVNRTDWDREKFLREDFLQMVRVLHNRC